jgi:exodeoxyribonuclease III
MKLISWNCQGAFRKKADSILLLHPDILVIQECEHPDKLLFSRTTPLPTQVLWFGDNKYKGLGIFSYSNYKFRLLEQYNSDIKIIVPIAVSGGEADFTLFAIWANHRDDPDGQYVEQVWKAVHHYDQLLSTSHCILTGDFNSNTIWDRPRRLGNHSAVVDKLAKNNIHSLYHTQQNQVQGKEEQATFFLYRNKQKPYHLDYCFASAELCQKVLEFEIGTFEQWIDQSDHVPLMIRFDF